jgi:hypothetical protein
MCAGWLVAAMGVLAACGPSAGARAGAGGGQPMKPPAVRDHVSEIGCHAWIAGGAPLSFHFVLSSPAAAAEPLLVPRVLAPLGAFVTVEVRDRAGALVYETRPPKFTPKLAPDSREAYVSIDPGYGYGTAFVDERATLAPGEYEITIAYSNLYFRGFAGHSLGEQRCSTTVRYSIP